jgi:hypothetical protein
MLMQQDFILQKWAVWPPLQADAEQDLARQGELLASVPKMLKRRLSSLAKIVFCAANQCIDEHTIIPTVFSSAQLIGTQCHCRAVFHCLAE